MLEKRKGRHLARRVQDDVYCTQKGSLRLRVGYTRMKHRMKCGPYEKGRELGEK